MRAQNHILTHQNPATLFPRSGVIPSEDSSLSDSATATLPSRIGAIFDGVDTKGSDTKGSDPKNAPVTVKFLICNKTYLSHALIVALCSGICQMYIYTVGFIVQAQYAFDEREGSAAGMQAIQVSTISLASFGGRVASGILSDYIYKNWRAQRQWLILGAILLSFIGQLFLISTNTIHGITFISLCVGTAYGILYGSYPSIIADEFGTGSFTTAWGLMCSGPLVFLFTLEKIFGYIYDNKSDENGVCHLGNLCYRGAFETSGLLCVVTAVFTGVMMYYRRRK